MFKYTTACVQAATCVAIMATPIYADQIKLTAASSHPPFLPWVEVITKHVVPETNARLAAMGSENEILWTEAYAGALFNAPNALEEITGGRCGGQLAGRHGCDGCERGIPRVLQLHLNRDCGWRGDDG